MLRTSSEGGRLRAAAGALVALMLLALGCRPQPQPEPEPAGGPRLVLLIVVDQLPTAYLERVTPLLRDGLRRLIDEGMLFADAHHRHAATLTATGAASLATGCHPRRHGIIGNYWQRPGGAGRVYAVEDPEHGVSPANLLEPTLGDRLKERWPRARVFAVSGKDRTAVLLGGRRADAAFWYERGQWRTNGYYGDQPQWLAAFNGQRLADLQLGRAWEPLPLSAEELAAAGVRPFDMGPLRPGFPHVFGGLEPAPDASLYDGLAGSPWLDENLTRFAERLIAEEELGSDGWPDLLALGYSALDSVGHRYGSESREFLDLVLRLDRSLGDLLASVERRIGAGNLVVALSSDHGVTPLPELGGGGRRVAADDVLCIQRAGVRLRERFGDERWLLPGPFVNPEALAARGVERAAVEEQAVLLLEACPAVERVWRREQLLAGEAPEAFVNSFHPERSPDLQIEFVPYFVPTLAAATHGSDEPYDTHVPLILRAPGVAAGRDAAPAATVDLVPTLAALVGLQPPPVDGVDLSPRLRPVAP